VIDHAPEVTRSGSGWLEEILVASMGNWPYAAVMLGG
jgi:hypothetical protein